MQHYYNLSLSYIMITRNSFTFATTVFILFSNYFFSCFSFVDNVVTLPQGKIRGNIIDDLETGQKYAEFIGIPYAQNRPFQKPKRPERWDGVSNCTTFRNRCYDVPINGNDFPTTFETNLQQTEECLTLNVFAPFPNNSEALYPVIIFIHGGAYSWGSSYDAPQATVRTLLVAKDVVVVTFNYRLGPWGFLQDNGSFVGNYGLWDQIVVLKWVKLNIGKFNGDPKRVTLMGQSAGAVSVTLLSLSPWSRNFFQNAIIMSGGVSAKWLPSRTSLIETSNVLLENFDCLNSSTKLDCISNVTVDDLRSFSINISDGSPKFGPNLQDVELFPKPLSVLFEESPVKNIIMGSTQDETGMFLFPPTDRLNSNMKILNPNTFSTKNFVNLFTTMYPEPKADVRSKGEKLFEILERFSLIGEANSTIILQKAFEMCNHYFAFKPLVEELECRQKLNHSVWLYSFDYFNPNDFSKNQVQKGAYHMMDLKYLFNQTVTDFSSWSELDFRVSDIITTLWTNFAKFGNPNAFINADNDTELWQKTTKGQPYQYLSINDKPEMKEHYNGYGQNPIYS